MVTVGGVTYVTTLSSSGSVTLYTSASAAIEFVVVG